MLNWVSFVRLKKIQEKKKIIKQKAEAAKKAKGITNGKKKNDDNVIVKYNPTCTCTDLTELKCFCSRMSYNFNN